MLSEGMWWILGLLGSADGNRWDDDVIFKNQARGTDDKGKKKEFVNVSVVLGVDWQVYTDSGAGSSTV